MPDARKAMEETLKGIAFPAGYSYTFEGSAFGDDDEATQQMMFNLVIALIMIYIVMAAVFESLLFPAAIMSGVLFSIFGVFWLFWLTGTEFNIMAFIGILVLMGVVVNNGIVMIEHINNLRRRGMTRTDALVDGSRERLRPILMTMGTAILAMLPIALSTSEGGNNMPAYYPMARAIAGGLAFSTIVSLLFLPTIYAILDDMRNNTSRVIQRARARRQRRRAGCGGGGDHDRLTRRDGLKQKRKREGLRLPVFLGATNRAASADDLAQHPQAAGPHADRGAQAGQEEVEQHPRDAVAPPAAQRLHVVAQRHEVRVGRLAHPRFGQRAQRARGQRRMQRRDR